MISVKTLLLVAALGAGFWAQADGTAASAAGPVSDSSAFTTDPTMIRDVQTQLNAKGYNVGTVDGIWGSRSTQALRDYQRAQGMDASGRLDAQSVSSLGVGSSLPTTGSGTLGSDPNATSGTSGTMDRQGRSPSSTGTDDSSNMGTGSGTSTGTGTGTGTTNDGGRTSDDAPTTP